MRGDSVHGDSLTKRDDSVHGDSLSRRVTVYMGIVHYEG